KDVEISADIHQFLRATLPATTAEQVTVFAAVTNLLWPREGELRQKALQSYNPFRQTVTTDPAIVRHLLITQSIPVVELSRTDWLDELRSMLQAHGQCRLAAAANQAQELRQAIVRLVVTPIDVGFVQFFPVVERVERKLGVILATLTLREQM